MSFFAGRLNGVPVFSLKNQTGGDINQHITPDSATIFHSSMPHVMIESTYEAALGNSGSGYFTGAVPTQVLNALATNRNRVILTEVIINNGGTEYSHLLQGGSIGCGYSLNVRYAISPSSIPGQITSDGTGQLRIRLAPSMDSTLHAGYYPSGSGTIQTQVARGTGGVYDFSGNSGLTNYNSNTANPTGFMGAGLGLYNVPGGSSIIQQNTWPANIGQIFPPNVFNSGYNRIFIRMTSVPEQIGNASSTIPISSTGTESARMASGSATSTGVGNPAWSAISSRQNTEDWLNKVASNTDAYAGTPVRVVWHITNMSYTGSGYTATNPFTGTDIILSRTNFTIRGVNMMSTSGKFVTQMSTDASLGARTDSINIGANIHAASPQTVYALPLSVASSTGAPTRWGGSGTWSNSVFNVTEFVSSALWSVNTNTESISNQWGVVWGPTRNPLKLLPNNVVSALITGGNYSVGAAATTNLTLGTYNLNMGTGNAVVCTIHFTDMTWLTCGGMTGQSPFPGTLNDSFNKSTLALSGSNIANNFTHQILTLPTNRYVPIYVAKTSLQAVRDGVSWDMPTGQRSISQIYYLRNLGNGTVQLTCSVSSNVQDSFTISLPNMRVTIQRLT